MATTVDRQRETMDPRGRKAVWGAWVGYFVDMFDVYLPVIVLAPAIAYFLAPELDAPTIAILSSVILIATLLARPLGALIWGHYADSIGRKRTTVIVMVGTGIATLLLAVLQGFQQWGWAAIFFFVLLRFIAGFCIGGAYTAASPLAMEHSPKRKRGLFSGLIMSGFPLAFASISLLTLLMITLVPAGGLDSSYVQWGWRIPFIIGGVLALALAAFYHFSVSESEIFETSGGTSAPLRELFSGENLKNFLQVFVLMCGFWFVTLWAAAVFPGLLASQAGLSSTEVTLTVAISYFVLAFAFVGAGLISQRVGRRALMIGLGILIVLVDAPLVYLFISAPPETLLGVNIWSMVIVVLASSHFGVAVSYITERFHTGVRASAFGLGYSLAIIPTSFYAFYQSIFAYFMPFEYTSLPLIIIGGLLIVVGAAWGPETKDVDFAASSSDLSEEKTFEPSRTTRNS